MILPEPGFTERDMDALWDANREAIREAIAAAGVDPRAIKGIACTGHGKGLYLWGRNGRPALNGIVSTDARAWAYPKRWNEDGTASRTFEKTCQSILACQPVSLLRWLKDNRPGVVESTRWVFEVKDYIRFMLTGEAFAEATDYSGSEDTRLSYSSNLAAMGMRRPMPKALEVIFRPGAACRRLYSFLSMVRITHCTVAGSNPSLTMSP